MTNGNDQAFAGRMMAFIANTEMEIAVPGLSKREKLSESAMIGLLASCSSDNFPDEATIKMIAIKSVLCADALIAELNKPVDNFPSH